MMNSLATILGGMLAQAETGTAGSSGDLLKHLLAAVVYAAVGILVYGVGIWSVTKILPFSLRKELEEDHNTAVAIIAGAMLIGISIIIAAAILG